MTERMAWPPAQLTLVSGDLELTPMCDADLPGLIELVLSGIHDPGTTPFIPPWTDAPANRAPAEFVRHYGRTLFKQVPGAVALEFAVRVRGTLIGVQGLSGENFPLLRTVETGSWLGLAHQGQGLGTRMRQAACAFAFDQLGAERITSHAFLDNPASRAVSRKVGYRPNGRDWKAPRGAVREQEVLLLTPETFVRGEPVVVSGADEYRAFVGLD